MVRASVLLTAAEIDRGEWPTGQGGSHGEVGRAGRQYLRAKMIPCAAQSRCRSLIGLICCSERRDDVAIPVHARRSNRYAPGPLAGIIGDG
jgi:hypothetical protein